MFVCRERGFNHEVLGGQQNAKRDHIEIKQWIIFHAEFRLMIDLIIYTPDQFLAADINKVVVAILQVSTTSTPSLQVIA